MGVREALEKLLREQRVNQAELARRIDRSPDWVNRRLPGARRQLGIDADEIPVLARALGVPCSAFFSDSDCSEMQTRGAGTLHVDQGMLSAVERLMVEDLAALPDVERDVARRMGALLIEYRNRILQEERGEG